MRGLAAGVLAGVLAGGCGSGAPAERPSSAAATTSPTTPVAEGRESAALRAVRRAGGTTEVLFSYSSGQAIRRVRVREVRGVTRLDVVLTQHTLEDLRSGCVRVRAALTATSVVRRWDGRGPVVSRARAGSRTSEVMDRACKAAADVAPGHAVDVRLPSGA